MERDNFDFFVVEKFGEPRSYSDKNNGELLQPWRVLYRKKGAKGVRQYFPRLSVDKNEDDAKEDTANWFYVIENPLKGYYELRESQ